MSKYVLFYSDTHVREYGSFPPFNQLDSNGLTKELNNLVKGFHFVADMIRQYKPLRVGLLGDFYNTTENQTARVLHTSHLCLGPVKQACDEVGCGHDIMDGNHDLLSESPKVSNIANLGGYGNIVHETTYVVLDNGFRLAYVPAWSNHGIMFSEMQKAQGQCDLICTHADFAGCKYESGAPSGSPLPAHWNVPVISGDIHLPQDVASVHYIGSLIQNKFYKATLEQMGGVLLYDIETGQVIRIRNTYSKHYIKHIDGSDTELPPPETCVLQVVSARSKEEVAEQYKAYEHFHVPAIAQKDEFKVTYSQFSLDNPEALLRLHVNKERPDAIEMLDSVIGRS